MLAPRDGISASQQRATYAATKVEELAFVVGASRTAAIRGVQPACKRRPAVFPHLTPGVHHEQSQRTRVWLTPTCLFGTTLAAANQHALHIGPRMLMSLFAPSSEDQHHHCAARGSASPQDQGYSHLTSPRMESLSKQLVARLDEVVKTQTEQTKLIRALDQRHVHIANTNGGSSLADPRPPFSGFTTDTPPNSQRSTAFDVNEASSVFKPATHPALRTKAFRRASWAWDPQFQEDLNHSFKVGKPLRSAGSQCTTHACVLDVLQSDTRLRRHSCTRSPSRSFE